MSKKILIHSIVFSPDGVSTAYLYNDIALKFKEGGYEVLVLTTTPHYNVIESELNRQPLKKKILGIYYESSFHGIKIKHVYQKKFNSTIFRICGFIYWHFISFILALLEKNIDIIISPSPPLTIGFLNIILSKLKGTKVIYNVQEIYPDLLIEKGGLKSNLIISFLKWIEKFVYNHSDAIVTIDQIFYETIISRVKNKAKLQIIPNFVDTNLYKPIKNEISTINKVLFPDKKSLKVMYAGNIGYAQDWDTLVALAVELKNDLIDFFIIGEGASKNYLINKKESLKLDNVHIIPYQSRELMPYLIAYSDLQFIFMSPHTEGHGFPSKVYTIMACAKPLIVCSGNNTPITNFLKDKNCSFLLTQKDIKYRVKTMAEILRNTTLHEYKIMGNNGYLNIKKDYSKEIVTEKYLSLVNNLFA